MTEILTSTSEDATKHEQLKELKGQLNKLNMVNEFAQYARLERRINAVTADIKSDCMFLSTIYDC